MQKSMSKNVSTCVICRREEKDLRKLLECGYCQKVEHVTCKNIVGSAVRKLRCQTYYCSEDCKAQHLRSPKPAEMESQVLKEVRMVLSEVKGTRAEMQAEMLAVRTTIGELEKFHNFLSEKLDCLMDDMKLVRREQSELKTKYEGLQSDQRATSSTVEQLELEVDRLKRRDLSKNVVIVGVPMVKNESTVQIVKKISVVIGYDLPDDAVLDAKRILSKVQSQNGMKSAPIKVVFSNETHKEELLLKKKSHGPLLLSTIDATFGDGKIVLRDELTSYGMNLLKEVREVQKQFDLKYVWPGRNGAVLVKKGDNSKIDVIRCLSDVDLLQRRNLKRQLTVSPEKPAQKR